MKIDLLQFKKAVDHGKPFIVKFKNDHCGACVDLDPIYQEISKLFSNIEFYDVDIEEEEELSELFVNSGVPTIYFIKNKKFMELEYPENGFDKKSLVKEIKKKLKEDNE